MPRANHRILSPARLPCQRRGTRATNFVHADGPARLEQRRDRRVPHTGEGRVHHVDHHFANASQGAIGLIDASGKTKETDIEHHNIPATAAPTDAAATRGKLNYESKCLACHSVGEGRKLGRDLLGMTRRRSNAWLARWLKESEKMLADDNDAKAMLKAYNNLPMPNQNLSDQEMQELIKYFHWFDVHGKAGHRRRRALTKLGHASCF